MLVRPTSAISEFLYLVIRDKKILNHKKGHDVRDFFLVYPLVISLIDAASKVEPRLVTSP